MKSLTNLKEKSNSYITLHSLVPIASLSSSPTILPLNHSAPITLASLLILKYIRHTCICAHTERLLWLLPWLWILSRLTPSPPSSLCLTLLSVSSERPIMTCTDCPPYFHTRDPIYPDLLFLFFFFIALIIF